MLIGSFAFIGLIVLTLTSNKTAIRLLSKNWKTIQRLSYVVFILAILHIYFYSGFWPASLPFALVSLAFIVLTLVLQFGGFFATIFKLPTGSPPKPPIGAVPSSSTGGSASALSTPTTPSVTTPIVQEQKQLMIPPEQKTNLIQTTTPKEASIPSSEKPTSAKPKLNPEQVEKIRSQLKAKLKEETKK
ncbi:hypothetical protein HZC07_01335 [Candidatus Micrarchaeota archaeon]|nr:hypothetical protein [Candidatus Micrarchaeota archaeon]